MKCKWYAEFEGVCTNGECPYRGDTCPTSEHPDVCKYAEEKPKPQLNAEELVTALRICAGLECEGCPCVYIMESGGNCDDYVKRKAADMLEKLAAEKEAKKPKNRVLTLEELKAYCEGGADAAPLWYDSKDYSDGNRWMVIDLPEHAFGSAATVNCFVNGHFFEPTYGEEWRCWLRKPTEEELRRTPWGGEGHV